MQEKVVLSLIFQGTFSRLRIYHILNNICLVNKYREVNCGLVNQEVDTVKDSALKLKKHYKETIT